MFGVYPEDSKQYTAQEGGLNREEEEPIPSDPKFDWTVSIDQLRLLQVKDAFCKRIIKKVMKDLTENKTHSYPYYIDEGILCRYVTDNKQRFET